MASNLAYGVPAAPHGTPLQPGQVAMQMDGGSRWDRKRLLRYAGIGAAALAGLALILGLSIGAPYGGMFLAMFRCLARCSLLLCALLLSYVMFDF